MEGSSWQAEVMRKVPEYVVFERMSQGEEVRCTKGKEKVKGSSIEEMRDKANSLVEEDTEEMKKWRGRSQEGVRITVGKGLRRRWRKRSWTSTRWTTAKREASLWDRGVYGKSKQYRRRKWREDC